MPAIPPPPKGRGFLAEDFMKLQNHFTTIEQSKQLLELGVIPAHTADCYYEDGLIRVIQMEEELDAIDNVIPCWSVGRLAEIINIISDYTVSIQLSSVYDFIKLCVSLLDVMKENKYGDIDFSKLEDVTF